MLLLFVSVVCRYNKTKIIDRPWQVKCSAASPRGCHHSLLILSLITRWLAMLAFSSYRGIAWTHNHYAGLRSDTHIRCLWSLYKGRLLILLIFILHNVMRDITSTLPVDVVPSARFTQNGRPMSIAGGRQE